jgi:hypothetical protein
MSYAGGEWLMLSIGGTLFVFGLAALWWDITKSETNDYVVGAFGVIIAVIGLGISMASMFAASARYNTLEAQRGLTYQGYNVADVDLSTEQGHQVTVIDPCDPGHLKKVHVHKFNGLRFGWRAITGPVASPTLLSPADAFPDCHAR